MIFNSFQAKKVEIAKPILNQITIIYLTAGNAFPFRVLQIK